MQDKTSSRSANARYTTIDGQRVDANGQIVPGTSGWAQHPQASRATRRLQPMPRDREQDAYDDRYEMQPLQQPNVNVSVSTGGQFYRPWKEELLISGWKTVGNLIAWPFRLIANLLGGVLRFALIAVVVPAMLFGSISFYQSHRDQSGTEMAHDVGKAGVGLVGAAFHGLWDGVFGGDDEKPAETRKGAAPEDAVPSKK
jgi:hypothetical protein